MDIVNLKDAPQHIPTIARWHHDEWGYLNPDKSLAYRTERLQRYLTDAAIPTFLLTVEGDDVIGTAGLVEHDMDSHPELSPWLASVYIRKDRRGQGLGKQLVLALMRFAKAQQLNRIYLFTPDQSAFYASLGWTKITKETYRKTPVTLMQYTF